MIGDEFSIVPTLWTGAPQPDMLAVMQQHLGPSLYSSTQQAEGVYVRLESDAHVLERIKLRRSTFESGRSDWDKRIVRNKLAPKARSTSGE